MVFGCSIILMTHQTKGVDRSNLKILCCHFVLNIVTRVKRDWENFLMNCDPVTWCRQVIFGVNLLYFMQKVIIVKLFLEVRM